MQIEVCYVVEEGLETGFSTKALFGGVQIVTQSNGQHVWTVRNPARKSRERSD